MEAKVPFFSLTRSWSGTTFALIKNSRRYELKIDDTFIREKSPYKDRAILNELLQDVVDGKTEGKIHDEVDHTVVVDIMYEQNKKPKSMPLTLRDEEYFIAVCLEDAEQKLKQVAGPGDEKKKSLVVQSDLRSLDRLLPKFYSHDLSAVNFTQMKRETLVTFMRNAYGSYSTEAGVYDWMNRSPHNVLMTWLSYMSYTYGYHYYFTYGVANVTNDTLSKATGLICFVQDKSFWHDYNTGYQNYQQFIPTDKELVTMTRTKKAR